MTASSHSGMVHAMTRRGVRSLAVGILAVGTILGFAGTAHGDDLATAQEAIDALTASLPGLTPVTGGGQVAPGPECDGAREADALAMEAGGLLQSYGGPGGGGTGQIVVFDSKRTAKRLFKLLTNDDAQACTVATTAAFSGGEAPTADLSRGRLSGVRGAVTVRGTITVGALEIEQTEAAVRRGTVVIRGVVGELPTSTTPLGPVFDDWVKETAEQF